ncbi:MAG: 30S ribosomal protein S4 [Nitrospinota bacterium]|nr:30S ribosomal protein S4 [Nitrospinota bacterium]MDH5678852.1 30S ribosomal protein S4 [Nitrospinota bacterium]MDH5755537.1 30S ribosomal protein S4 [Nitrospinota bacterium]
MARYNGPSCRLCRREGLKLFLKGERCVSKKCAMERRPYAPGMAGQRRARVKEYGQQLREKQKVRRIYGVLETQFRGYFKIAEKTRGVTGENLLRLLESRLDNVVYLLGFAPSRAMSRQLVLHNHFSVNGKDVNIPSYRLQKGDTVAVREKKKKAEYLLESVKSRGDNQIPDWLSLDRAAMSGHLADMPRRESIQTPIEEQLIVELYSK